MADSNSGGAAQPPAKPRCGAKNRPGAKHARCQAWPLPGSKRCGKHGGLTPRGPASPHYQHGLRVRHLPPDLRKLVLEANSDPDLMKIRVDVATVEMLLAQLHGRLKEGRAVPVNIETRVLALIEQRRKLLDSEAKRLRDLQLMVSAERFVQAQKWAAEATAEVIRAICQKHSDDPEQWLLQVRMRYQRLRLPAAIEDNDGDETES